MTPSDPRSTTQSTLDDASQATAERTPFDNHASDNASSDASDGFSDGFSNDAAQRESERLALAEELEEKRRLARAAAVKRVRGGRGTKILLGFAALFACALGGIQYQREKLHQWLWAEIPMPTDRIARVPQKWDPPTLAKRLATTGKVRDSKTFLEAARTVGLMEVLPGGYELPPIAGPGDLAVIFKAGPTMENVTFPEGFTCRRIAERLQARGFKNAPGLLKLAYPNSDPNAPSPIEGHWFPDTYLLSRNASAQVLAGRLSERFGEVVEQLPSRLPKILAKPMTRAQLITLASIVERETSVESERAIVAGVLLNRLNQKMRLECDATIQYARERAQAAGKLDVGHKSRLSYRDIDAVKKSPFNTYESKGLPPGPICNPGRAALEAAARPAATKSKYLFYVMSPALGRHRFSADYKQFLRDKALYKQELKTAKR